MGGGDGSHLGYSLLGFHSLGEYGRSLVRTPQRLATRFFMRRSFAEQQYDKGREGDMKKVLVRGQDVGGTGPHSSSSTSSGSSRRLQQLQQQG
jgi:hypothetical protein